MTVAIIMPQKIAREDFLISISRRDAISDPVHAPVPGSGIPTNSISPQNSYFFTWSLFLIALSSNFITSPRKSFVFFKTLKICLINNRINGIGIIFPTIHSGIAFAALKGHKVGDRVEVKVNDNYSYFLEIRSIDKTGSEDEEIRGFW